MLMPIPARISLSASVRATPWSVRVCVAVWVRYIGSDDAEYVNTRKRVQNAFDEVWLTENHAVWHLLAASQDGPTLRRVSVKAKPDGALFKRGLDGTFAPAGQRPSLAAPQNHAMRDEPPAHRQCRRISARHLRSPLTRPTLPALKDHLRTFQPDPRGPGAPYRLNNGVCHE